MSNARKLADNLPTEGQLGNRNILINGAHQVSQRHGSSSVTVAANDHFVVDRFKIQDYSDATFSSQQVTDAPEGFRNSSKITVTGTDTSLGTTQYQRFVQPIEGLNVSHLNYGWSFAQTTTLSFHVKSSLTGTFYVFAFNSAANRAFVSAYTIDTANTWEKKIIKITGDQGGTWLKDNGVGMYLGWSLGTGTNFQTSTLDAWQGSFEMAGSNQVNFAGTNGATWQVTGCQLEVGSQASPFEHEPVGVTLSKCQRYTHIIGDTQYQALGIGAMYTATNGIFYVHTPVPMRSTPSVSKTVDGNTVWLQSYVGSSGLNSNPTPQLGENSTNGRQNNFRIYVPSSNNSTTAGYSSWNQVMPNASLILEAEL